MRELGRKEPVANTGKLIEAKARAVSLGSLDKAVVSLLVIPLILM